MTMTTPPDAPQPESPPAKAGVPATPADPAPAAAKPLRPDGELGGHTVQDHEQPERVVKARPPAAAAPNATVGDAAVTPVVLRSSANASAADDALATAITHALAHMLSRSMQAAVLAAVRASRVPVKASPAAALPTVPTAEVKPAAAAVASGDAPVAAAKAPAASTASAAGNVSDGKPEGDVVPGVAGEASLPADPALE